MAWVGSQLTLGYMAAPVLFHMLERSSAGAVAAQLFKVEGYLGVACAVVMLLIANRHVRGGFVEYKRVRSIVAAMLACVLIGYFALQPWMNALRLAAQAEGTDVGHSIYATRFGILHGVSSLFYLIESLLGVALVWKLPASVGGMAVERGARGSAEKVAS